MLYDLNVPWSATQSPLQLQRTISFLSELGYDTLALNHTITGSLPSQIANPIPTTHSFDLPKKTVLLRRCTLCISDPTQNHRLPTLSAAYDILALRPTTEKAFLAACLTLDSHSIISLDLTQRFPFHFRPKLFMTAINRGIRFEICYSQSVDSGGGDGNTARRNFIGNVIAIVRATRGRGLVVSSGAQSVLGARAPADVLNLLGVWGLKMERGVESLGVNPRGVVVNEGLRRTSFRGVIDVVDGGEKAVKDPVQENGAKDKGNPLNGAGKKQNGKRKAEETNGEATPQLSKRAAKKAKLKALQEEKAIPSPASDTPSKLPLTAENTPSKSQATANG
jgi:ribonuclease P/MRP protein subunit RPP1